MPKSTGTISSATQELSVPSAPHSPFRWGDRPPPSTENRGMTKIMTSEQRAAIAFTRLKELMDDLGYSEELAISYIYNRAGEDSEIGKKAVKQWYSRSSIPPYMIFTLADVLGVDVGWLGGSDRLTKARAIQKDGFYENEMARLVLVRAEERGHRPKKAG